MPILLPTPAEALGAGSSESIVKGTGEQVPSGVAGLLFYNGLVMNKRDWFDTIVITKIDGLGDPDVRDDRENNPQRDGETAFDSFYGGRTLVLNGYIRAFSYDKMMDLWTALSSAFLPLEEMPLIMQGKNFATSCQIFCKKNAPISKSDEQTRDDLFRRDFMITVRASLPAFVSLDQQLNFLSMGDIDAFDVWDSSKYEASTGSLANLKAEGGVLLSTNNTTRVMTRKDQTVDFVYPRLSIDYKGETSFAGSVVGARLKRIDANNYLRVRITATGSMELVKVDEGEETTLGAPSMIKGASPVTRSLGTTYRTTFRIEGKRVYVEHGPAGGEPVDIGTWELPGAWIVKYITGVRAKSWLEITNPNTSYSWDNFIFSSAQNEGESSLEIINRGNYKSLPKFHLTGPITDPIIRNLTTDDELSFETGTSIPAGETWVADMAEGTLVDGDGENQFNALAAESDLPFIAPGVNDIRLLGSEAGTMIKGTNQYQTALTVYNRHSWF